MRPTYSVHVGNIGNVQYGSRKEAIATFKEYVEQSKSGLGRAGHESVALLKDGVPIKEFDPFTPKPKKGTFEAAVWNILGPFVGDEPMLVDLVSYGLTCGPEGGWEVNDAHFMCTGLEAHQALQAICERYKTWKHNYCPDARVKDLENISDEGDSPCLEVRGIPFMEIRIS